MYHTHPTSYFSFVASVFRVRLYLPKLNLLKQPPVLDGEGLPYARGVVDGVSDQLALLPELQVDVVLVVLAADVRHVDGDEEVGLLVLEAHEGQDYGGEVGRARARCAAAAAAALGFRRRRRGLGGQRGDEGVGWYVFAVRCGAPGLATGFVHQNSYV